MTKIIPLETPTLGDRSYLAHDGSTALGVDPFDYAEAAGLPLTRDAA